MFGAGNIRILSNSDDLQEKMKTRYSAKKRRKRERKMHARPSKISPTKFVSVSNLFCQLSLSKNWISINVNDNKASMPFFPLY